MTSNDARAVTWDRVATAGALAIVALSWALLASSLGRVEYHKGVDEGHYVVYAQSIRATGLAGFPDLFRDYVEDSSRWRYPNPLRMAYIALSGPWAGAADDGFVALSRLSVLCHGLAVLASFFFARRCLGPSRALMLTALLACSPLWLGLGRRALLDGFAVLWAVLSIWPFFEAVRAPERRSARVLFGAVFAIALLAKETHVLLVLPFAGFVAIERFARGNPLPLGRLALAVALPCVAVGSLWSLAAGGPGVVLELVGIILQSPETNPHANAFGGGPWTRYIVDFLLLSPLPTLLAIAGLGWLGLRRSSRDTEPTLVYFAVVTIGVLLAFDFFTKNVRYVAMLELPIRVFAVVVLWRVFQEGRTRALQIACAAVVLALCALDLRTFYAMFVELGLYDPISVDLLAIRGIIPPGP